jgi:hypothetical protein
MMAISHGIAGSVWIGYVCWAYYAFGQGFRW